MKFDWEESLGHGLRYTETTEGAEESFYPFLRLGWANNKRPARLCQLWAEGVKEPVAYLTLFGYESRIGKVALAVEGIGGVATPPKWRRKGYSAKLLRLAVPRAAERVDLLYLNGIQGFYGAFGFSTCFVESEMRLSVRNAEAARDLPDATIRDMVAGDLDKVCELCNDVRQIHTGTTLRRTDNFAGPRPESDWEAGEKGSVLERQGVVEGYVIFAQTKFGGTERFSVVEMIGVDPAVTEALVAEVARLAIDRRLESVPFLEVSESMSGRVLRRLGCEATLQYDTNAGWMGRILRRDSFVHRIAPELERRAGEFHREALEALARGEIYADNGVLLQLVTGFRSWRDVADLGHRLPARYEGFVRRWFAGFGGPEWPMPYAYRLDWY
jgi:GNAT superfamily N-acetyltransferase